MRLSLATKISATIIGVLMLALLSSVVSIASAYRFERFQQTVVDENLASLRAAEELEIALLAQRGYVSSYILDGGNTDWLTRLNAQLQHFDDWLVTARATARSDAERELLDKLEVVQDAYARKRDQVVELYNAGQQEEAKQILLRDVAQLYDQSYQLCEAFITANVQLVTTTSEQVRRQVEQVTVVITVTLLVTVCLAMVLLWLFFQGVVFPLRRMAADARLAAGEGGFAFGDTRGDELRELGHFMQLLMVDVAETRSDLEQSRTLLAQAETLAAVGKLAASVAHEIRNPLTSMKMWLYSLRRSFGPSDELRDKLDLVSDEIIRLDRIVRHFLEFSRPPQLKLSTQDVPRVVGKTLELLKHRLEEQDIEVSRQDEPELPSVLADAEQLRQVFLNLINNAIEAMPRGGSLRISLSQARRAGHVMVAVRLADNGAGMTKEVRERVFEPFFTTKAEGTGLGLCIAASIMARHGGAILLESSTPSGTQWAVWIPAMEANRHG